MAEELLRGALDAGQIGTWRWDHASGAVFWDKRLSQLFGLSREDFVGTFDGWIAKIHVDDRQRVLDAVAEGVSSKAGFRFDHRCVWPDESVHWLEGIGDVQLDASGEVIGATGVALGIDQRQHLSAQLTRLLEIERTARERSEFLARTGEVLASALDVDDLVEQVTLAAVPDLADWCSVVLTVDRPHDDPLVSVAHIDPAMVVWAKRLQTRFPYDPTAVTGAPAVIRSGTTEFHRSIDAELIAEAIEDVELRDIITNMGLQSSITVALRSSAGILGSLQLVRASGAELYTTADVVLAEDLARTIGAALGNAVLYQRQRRARAALDTLQRLTGRLAEAVTVDDISAAAVTFGATGIGAQTGLLYLLGQDDLLHLAASIGYEPGDLDDWQTIDRSTSAPITDAIRTHAPMIFRDRAEMNERYPYMIDNPVQDSALIALPLELRGRTVGSLVFAFRHRHVLADEELAMLVTLAGRCSGALERARLYDEQHHVASVLQASLLPGTLQPPPGFTVAARYWPAAIGSPVGGDFYDVFPVGDGRWGIAVGDICGKGVEAAALTALTRHTIRAAARHLHSPADVLHATQQALVAYDTATYCTVCFGFLTDVETNSPQLQIALGGHPQPLLRHPDGTVEVIGAPGTLLGLVTPHFTDTTYDLGSGTTLMMFTDGITDAPRNQSVPYDALVEVLADHGTGQPEDVADVVRALIERYRPIGSGDDTALLILQHRPTSPTERPIR